MMFNSSNGQDDVILTRYLKEPNNTENIRVGAAVALIDTSKKILLEQRSDLGWWGLVGGKLEVGESPTACAIREVLEETSLNLVDSHLTLFGVYGDPLDGRILQYPDARVHLIDIIYIAIVSDFTSVQLSSESLDLKLFSSHQIPSNIVPPAQRPLSDLILAGIIL